MQLCELYLNDQALTFDTAPTIAELLTHQGLATQRLVVAVNDAVVPRTQFAQHRLHAQDRVEIMTPITGG